MATVSAVVELDDTLFGWSVPDVKSIVTGSAAETDKVPQSANTVKTVLRAAFFWANFFAFFIIKLPP